VAAIRQATDRQINIFRGLFMIAAAQINQLAARTLSAEEGFVYP
jgi:hypothetical protein